MGNKLSGSMAKVAVISLLETACHKQPMPPLNVNAAATFISGSKAGWWQYCESKGERTYPHCIIWNLRGAVLYDERFFPYDQRGYVSATELRIDSSNPSGGPSEIALSNGRILLPESRFSELKQFLDVVRSPKSR